MRDDGGLKGDLVGGAVHLSEGGRELPGIRLDSMGKSSKVGLEEPGSCCDPGNISCTDGSEV